MASARHWIQASRPLAQVNIAGPLVLGQVAAWHLTRSLDWVWFAAALIWGVVDHLFVVYANDYADRHADTVDRTTISGGSGVIPERKLHPSELRRAAALAGLVLVLGSLALGYLGRPWTPVYAILAIALLWLYSFAPARLSYRGGGELLQAVGLGAGLPSLGYYLQTETAIAPLWVVGPATILGFCGNITTALPDIEVDRKAGKRTWPVRFGILNARRTASAGIAFASFGVFLWTPSVPIGWRAVVGVAPLLPLLIGARAADALGAAWWTSIALNLLIVLWTAMMLLAP